MFRALFFAVGKGFLRRREGFGLLVLLLLEIAYLFKHLFGATLAFRQRFVQLCDRALFISTGIHKRRHFLRGIVKLPGRILVLCLQGAALFFAVCQRVPGIRDCFLTALLLGAVFCFQLSHRFFLLSFQRRKFSSSRVLL